MPSVQSQRTGNHKGGAAEGRPPLWRRPKAASFVLALNNAHFLSLDTAHASRLNKADVLALNTAHAWRLSNKICPMFTANTKETTRAAEGCPPLWRRPKAASFVLALNTGHILLLRRKTCALLRAKTSALLRRMTWAVLRARTCACSEPKQRKPQRGAGGLFHFPFL